MDTLEVIGGINDAIKLLTSKRGELANGALRIWQLVAHAEKHLNAQVAALLSEQGK